MTVTVNILAASILDDLVAGLVKQEALETYAKFKDVERLGAPVVIQSHGPTKDIFGQDRVKLKTNDTNKYFTCENCGRSISGGRFAQHINKCLERRRK